MNVIKSGLYHNVDSDVIREIKLPVPVSGRPIEHAPNSEALSKHFPNKSLRINTKRKCYNGL